MAYLDRDDDIDVLHMSVRSTNCLRRQGINTVGALLDFPTDELINIPNMGKKSVSEIIDVIATVQLSPLDVSERVEKLDAESDDLYPEDAIYLDENGVILKDLLLCKMKMSNRLKNCLISNDFIHTSQILGMTKDDFAAIKNLGGKSIWEAVEFEQQLRIIHVSLQDANSSLTKIQNIIYELVAAYGQNEKYWLRILIPTRKEYPDVQGESFIYCLYQSDILRNAAKKLILRLLEEIDDDVEIETLSHRLPKHLYNTTILQDLLIELESNNLIISSEGIVCRKYPSIMEYVMNLSDETEKYVLREKLTGKTLQEIADLLHLSRERVRQIINKALKDPPRFEEEKYLSLYEKYDFSKDDFVLAFDEPTETYYYLDLVAKKGKQEIESILSDESFAPKIRKMAEKAVYKNYITLNGVRIKKSRPDLVKYFVKNFCRETTKYEEFLDLYSNWLDELGIKSEKLCLDFRTYENYLSDAEYVLWKRGKTFRYYDIFSRDYTDLISTLNLSYYEGLELSTYKFFGEYSDLMREYDIQDEYELHNLLKKIWVDKNGKVSFNMNPMIAVGVDVDRINQLYQLLLQYAPIDAFDFANLCEEEYGFRASTVAANYLKSFDQYFYNGMYRIDFKELPSDHFKRMQYALDRDYYTIADVKRIYSKEFPNADVSLITSYILKKLGFAVYNSYVIRKTYASAVDYFDHLLLQEDIVDTNKFESSIFAHAAFTSELYRLKSERQIVEFEPHKYINIRRLNEVGITISDIKNYCDEVKRFVDKGDYFTVYSLRKNGFIHHLDDLGFDDWFYASLLIEEKDTFSYRRMGGRKLLYRGCVDVQLGDFLYDLITRLQKIDIWDLHNMLNEEYGLEISRLIETVQKSDMYYDAIMEAVYIDYDTYFEEI